MSNIKERAEELLSSNSLLHYEKTKSIIRDLLTELAAKGKELENEYQERVQMQYKINALEEEKYFKEKELEKAEKVIFDINIEHGLYSISSCAEQKEMDHIGKILYQHKLANYEGDKG